MGESEALVCLLPGQSHISWRWARGSVLAPGLGYIRLPETGGLKLKHLLLTALEAGKSKIKVWQTQCPVRTLFLAGRWPSSCCVLPRWPADRARCPRLCYKSPKPIHGGSTLMTNRSQRPHLLIPAGWGLRLQHLKFGGGHICEYLFSP